MIRHGLLSLLTLAICAITFTSCTKSIDQKLEDLKKEKLAFEKKVATIKNDSLRQQAKEFGGMLFWFQEIDLDNQRAPKDTTYEENPFLILDDYPTTTELANNYLNGMIVEKDGSRGDKLELKVHYPFALPFGKKTAWKSVQFDDKTSSGIIEDANDTLMARQVVRTNWNGEEGFDILYPDEKVVAAMPLSITGTVEAQVPKSILKFAFANNETGDTKEQNGIKVKLVSIKGHAVKIEVVNPHKLDPAVNTEDLDQVKILASDKTKQFLGQSGSSSGPDDLLDYYKSLLDKVIDNPENVKTLQKDLEKAQDKYDEKHKNTSYYTIYCKGSVEDVLVYVMDYSKARIIKKSVTLPIYAFKSKARGYYSKEPYEPVFDIPSPVTAYDNSLKKLLGEKLELTQADLASKITIHQSPVTRMTSSGETENPSLSFIYPEIMSARFVEDIIRYKVPKEIAFYEEKGGKEVFIPKDSIDYSDGNYQSIATPYVQFQSNRIDFYPAKFPAKAKYVKGLIQIDLADISKTNYTLNKLPTGITVACNKVMIDEAVVKTKILVYAKDKAGKYLKQITSVNFTRGDSFGPNIKVDYYYGMPYTLECYQQTGDRLADYHFEVNLMEEEKKKDENKSK